MGKIVCYCHNYSVDDLESDLLQHGRSTILVRIVVLAGKGKCDCRHNNPKGR